MHPLHLSWVPVLWSVRNKCWQLLLLKMVSKVRYTNGPTVWSNRSQKKYDPDKTTISTALHYS